MKILKINNRDYPLKFTTKTVADLNAKGITFLALSEDMQELRLDRLYEAFYYGLKTLDRDLKIDDAYNLIDLYFEDENADTEQFFMEIMEEYAKSVGLGKKFKEEMKKAKEKAKEEATIQ